jgi:hypothetical protein
LAEWTHLPSQMTFLNGVFGVPKPETVFFSELQNRVLVDLEYCPGLKTAANIPSSHIQFWCCTNFLQLLVEISESQYYSTIRAFFEFPMKKCPDLLVMSLAQINPRKGGPIMDEIFSILFPDYFNKHNCSTELLEALWKVNSDLFIKSISAICSSETANIS